MAWFADLAPIEYFGRELQTCLRAVGWLARDAEFVKGAVSRNFYVRLRQLVENPWQPMAAGGVHACELCQFEPEAAATANVFVPNGKFIYVAPALILHYINAHGYAPPDEFCEAVLTCPDTRSMDYKRLLLASGWILGRGNQA